MSDTEQRPVHVVVNCRTREVVRTPVTDEEWAAQRARATAAAEAEAAEAAERERLRQAVAAHPDELVRELARRAGLA